MIKLNGEEVKVEHFPDGTQRLNIDRYDYDIEYDQKPICIRWKYENDSELFTLICIKKYLDEKFPKEKHINLKMNYIPNGRMDRTKEHREVFTLKYFADVINSLKFDCVNVFDCHSDVSRCLFNNIVETDARFYILDVLSRIKYQEIVFYFPDAGSNKKYGEVLLFSYSHMKKYCYGEKDRDWKTGQIKGLNIVTNGIDLKGKTILMIDDIISYGGSMYYSALKLKELGVDKIYAYASHTENSVLDKEKGTFIKLLEDGTVEKLFTTDSLFSGEHERIEVL